MSKNLLFTLSLIALTQACSSASPIIEAAKSNSGFQNAVFEGNITSVSDNENELIEYRVFQHGNSGFVTLNEVREMAENRANRFCEQRKLGYQVIKEQTSVPPHILGNFPRVELIFVCEEASKSKTKNSVEAYDQLERLGRLLEKGLITREEFEKEKAKLFD
nr:SHOCT domain-containing protein [uncultured Glaciecola sp.]